MKAKPALKDQFADAKALIQLKQYDKARALLRTIDHPTAQEWLAKLDKIAPEKRKRSPASVIILVLLICGALYGVSNALQNFNQTVGDAAQSANRNLAPAFTKAADTAVAAAIATLPATQVADTPSATATITETSTATQLVVAQVQAASVTPSATITDTPTSTQSPPTLSPAPTNAPVPTSAPPEVWYTISTANLRSCASTSCDQVVQLSGSTAINIIGFEQGEDYRGSDIWRVVDYNGQRVYVHSSLVAVNPPQPTIAPVQVIYPTSAPVQVVPAAPPANPGLVCPSNCAEAVSLGWTAQQAGQCSNLDRDDDGVACYGD